MAQNIAQGALRVIDANLNRAKEGLRVIEDIFRFILNDNALRLRARSIRHALDTLAQESIGKKAIARRNSKRDIGRFVDRLEIKRTNYADILYSNLQRTKESLRVLEEFFKLIAPAKVMVVKKMRYAMYELERSVLGKRNANLR